MPPPQNSRNCSPRNSSSAACSLTSWTRWRTWRARRSRGPHWTNLWTTFPPTEGCWWNLRTQRSLIWWGYMNTGPFGSLVLLLISVAFCVNKSYKCLFIISQQRGLLSVSLCNIKKMEIDQWLYRVCHISSVWGTFKHKIHSLNTGKAQCCWCNLKFSLFFFLSHPLCYPLFDLESNGCCVSALLYVVYLW